MKLITKVNDLIVLDKAALDHISKIQGEVAVISIVGAYRTGKSFLLRTFMGQLDADSKKQFYVGHKDEAMTKGIWISDDVLKIKNKSGEEISLIFVDTEVIKLWILKNKI